MTRPYRLYDGKTQLRWRYYADPVRALKGALIEAGWSKPGRTIEVVNLESGRLIGSYTRRLSGIHFNTGD